MGVRIGGKSGLVPLLCLAGLGATWRVLACEGTPSKAPAACGTPVTAPASGRRIAKRNPKDDATLAYVPAGEFIMGSSAAEIAAACKGRRAISRDSLRGESPRRRVYLDAYWIYRTPVTVAQYRRFCTATGHEMPAQLTEDPAGDVPVVRVSWNDANAYASWAGVRLPTEAEWEKAARGPAGRIYPWGNAFDPSRCVNGAGSGLQPDEDNLRLSPLPVHARRSGASPYGCLDMAGNVSQWCADWYGEEYYASAPYRNPTGPESGTRRVCRGGCFANIRPASYRAAWRASELPDYSSALIGFRCAVSAEPHKELTKYVPSAPRRWTTESAAPRRFQPGWDRRNDPAAAEAGRLTPHRWWEPTSTGPSALRPRWRNSQAPGLLPRAGSGEAEWFWNSHKKAQSSQ